MDGAPPAAKRFGWYVPQDDGTLDLAFQDGEFSDESWQELRKVVAIIPNLRPIVIDFLALEQDFQALVCIESAIARSIERLPNPIGVVPAILTPAYAQAQRHISNFLGAASAFRDRAKARLAEMHGSNSDYSENLKVAISAAYDESRAYRILYNLRNYAQHHASPVSIMPISGHATR